MVREVSYGIEEIISKDGCYLRILCIHKPVYSRDIQMVPRSGFDPSKPPFIIDGKSLQPVLERCDKVSAPQSPVRVTSGLCSIVPSQASTQGLEEQSEIASTAYEAYQATPSRAKAKEEDSDEIIIFEILNFTTPKKIKIKKEKKDKKPKKGTRVRTSSASRTPLALRNPPLEDDLYLGSLFGSMSEDEVDLLSSPKPGPVNPPTPEPIEVDDVELEIHPSQAEQLIADADQVYSRLNKQVCIPNKCTLHQILCDLASRIATRNDLAGVMRGMPPAEARATIDDIERQNQNPRNNSRQPLNNLNTSPVPTKSQKYNEGYKLWKELKKAEKEERAEKACQKKST
ncbi:hypothetical protein DAPPUDRAFT_105070 [Daphnia pulex]|uniref:Uncharacterized protein n=1 Tax=Daphnia pulex TaxID=6669 RepID=E9GPB7_DAPPU|nr:hypothetical protein DAPPUDRAFT_105070 [Daphnia pulex]|eukprot:EFX78709.1 hypothetical protein DAPPUDRAFT_105070 [Daphnia pulex]